MLEKLNEVQGYDLRLDTLQAEIEKTPPELVAIRQRKEELERLLQNKILERDGLRKRVSDNELDLQALQERKRAAAEASLRADSGKEASQYQNQELQFSTRIQELEDDTLPLMGSLESVNEEIDALDASLAELVPELTALAEQEEARVAELHREIEAVRQSRLALAGTLDRLLLKQYEQVRRARRGLGMVEIVSNQRCGGCNVRLPIHVVQKARKPQAVTRCPSCGRILWFKGD